MENSKRNWKLSKKAKNPRSQWEWTAPHLLDSMIYYLTSGVFCYAKRSTKQTIYARIQKMNSTPFVRQYDILSNKWGAVQQKTLRGFYYVVGVDACHRPAWRAESGILPWNIVNGRGRTMRAPVVWNDKNNCERHLLILMQTAAGKQGIIPDGQGKNDGARQETSWLFAIPM